MPVPVAAVPGAHLLAQKRRTAARLIRDVCDRRQLHWTYGDLALALLDRFSARQRQRALDHYAMVAFVCFGLACKVLTDEYDTRWRNVRSMFSECTGFFFTMPLLVTDEALVETEREVLAALHYHIPYSSLRIEEDV